ncbi:FAD-binding oxidoreductase [Actinomadura kijaniata]|uniref:FAD-binding oxidoreductase n=1 Tax=Actinomadura kijaniata TaxID=46161 RepID=UPI0008319EB0|nr:FAD-binding protein [Actinomadura kijaniata]
MVEHTRRTVLRGGTIAAASAPLVGVPSFGEASARGPVAVGPGDPRYPSLVRRGYNRRFEGRPEQVHVVRSTEDVVRAVGDAVRAGRRVAVRGGGHCFEDFVDDPAVRVLIDLSQMAAVGHDRRRDAFVVEAGATLGEVYRRLYLGWGVTVPAGTHGQVGVGGHVSGGGYGALCRLHGLSVDYLYAVEVVVVDRAGRARSVVATREPSDPNRDLWWAHTGGGGGNFGVVTRYWFRSLPAPPPTVLDFTLQWPWERLDRDTFVRLLRNYGRWGERNSAPGSPAAALYGEFSLTSRPSEAISLSGQVAGSGRVLDELVAALGHGVEARPVRQTSTLPWLTAAVHGLDGGPGPFYRIKIKSGYQRRGFTDRQLVVIHRHLTRSDYGHPSGQMFVNTYGGRVNAVRPGATAVAHRDSIFKVGYLVGWENAAEDARHLAWIREFYRDVYADSGGVPADGAFINYPDSDLADPRWNASGTPWHALYYKDGYARLQQVKRRWDPRDVFRHALSVRPT